MAGWSMISWKSWPARAAAPAAAGSPSGTARSWPPSAVPGSGRWMHGRRFGFPMKTPMCRPSTAPLSLIHIFNGIGERAGNASLEEIVMALHTRRDFYEAETEMCIRDSSISAKTASGRDICVTS